MRFFLPYVRSRIEESEEELLFKNYISDLVKGICISLGGKVEKRFYDFIKQEPVDTRTGEEIIEMMKKKIGGTAE